MFGEFTATLAAVLVLLLLGAGTAKAQTVGFSSATVDGLKVTVTLTGNRSGCPALQAWTIDIDGTDFKPGSLRCESSSVLLWLHEHTAPGSAQTYKGKRLK